MHCPNFCPQFIAPCLPSMHCPIFTPNTLPHFLPNAMPNFHLNAVPHFHPNLCPQCIAPFLPPNTLPQSHPRQFSPIPLPPICPNFLPNKFANKYARFFPLIRGPNLHPLVLWDFYNTRGWRLSVTCRPNLRRSPLTTGVLKGVNMVPSVPRGV